MKSVGVNAGEGPEILGAEQRMALGSRASAEKR